MSKNPYLIDQVVQDPDMFFGRRQEFALLQDHIRQGMSVAVVGMRRIGKSSLLFQFAYQTRRRSDSFVLAYLDLHDSRFHTVSGLLSMILKRLDVRVNRKYRFAHVRRMDVFVKAIEQMHNDGYRAVLCLDEIDLLLKHPGFDYEFFEAWNQLGREGKLLFVTASGNPLADVMQDNNDPMPFCQLFTQMNLAGLSQSDARVLLTQPFRRARTQRILPPRYIRTALQLAGGHPYFLQIAGLLLWQHGAIEAPLWREKFIELAEQPIDELWAGLKNEEQIVASHIAGKNVVLPDAWQNTQAHLLQRGVLELNERGRLYLFTPLLAEWIKEGRLEEQTDDDDGHHSAVYHAPSLSYANKTLLLSYILISLLFASTLTWVTWQFFLETTIYLLAIFVISLLLTLLVINQVTQGQLLAWLKKWLK